MGRYSNYQYALILSLAGYGLPMLLVSLYLFYNKRNRSVLTIGGSLAGGIDTCQWRYNYENAPDGEFKIQHAYINCIIYEDYHRTTTGNSRIL